MSESKELSKSQKFERPGRKFNASNFGGKAARRTANYLSNLYAFVWKNSQNHQANHALNAAGSTGVGELICDTNQSIDAQLADEWNAQRETGGAPTKRLTPNFEVSPESVSLYAQSVCHAQTRHTPFVDIISRIESKDGSILFPRKFMPHLAQTGECFKFDMIVLEKLFAQRSMRGFFYEPNEVYLVRMCESSMADPNFFRKVTDLARTHYFDLSTLCFDMDAQMLERDMNFFDAFARQAEAAGCSVAASVTKIPELDLAELATRKLRYLKLSARCLDRINAKTNLMDSLQELVKRCERLGMPVVAEQVDRQPLMDVVKEMGIQFLQGFLVVPPVHIEWVNID